MTTRYLLIAAAILTMQDNHAPVVKIQTPVLHTAVSSGTPVPYEITVSDKEDGDSRYDEINPKEVILEIRATASASTTTSTTASPGAALKDPGLATMARSNCFNCHQFNGKLIGPSLADIARRYGRLTAATTDTLTKRIKDGSAGIWGKEKMPSHPEIGIDNIRAMVKWIEKYAATPGVTFQNGNTGVLQLPGTANSGVAKPGIYILTAAYTDHGAKDTKTGPYLTGLDQLTFTIK